jgi:tetratricopeptide (TPR) repeat protein
LLAALRSMQGRSGLELVERVLGDDPLHPLALIEKALARGGSGQLSPLVIDAQDVIEAAVTYAEVGLLQRAVGALRLARGAGAIGARQPFVHFYLGYYNALLGHHARARKSFAAGAALPVDLVFPFRHESRAMLALGRRLLPESWQLAYYEGLLVASSGQGELALKHLEQGARGKSPSAAFYGTRGVIERDLLGRCDLAVTSFAKAIALRRDDPELHIAHDLCLAQLGKTARRVAHLACVPSGVARNAGVLMRRVHLELTRERYDEGLKILASHSFPPWEGGTEARELYLLALHGQALRALERGQAKAALAALSRAMDYPEKLGSGRPADPDHTREYYLQGLCLLKSGDESAARVLFEKAGAERAERESLSTIFQALALGALGEVLRSERLLARVDAVLLRQRASIELEALSADDALALALIAWAKGERARAVALVRSTMAVAPNRLWPSLLLRFLSSGAQPIAEIRRASETGQGIGPARLRR